MSDFKQILTLDSATQRMLLADANALLSDKTAEQRVAWALENLPDTHFLSSSFGIQAAVMLHLLTQQQPDIPVVLTDTGYLFPETYQFIESLSERLPERCRRVCCRVPSRDCRRIVAALSQRRGAPVV